MPDSAGQPARLTAYPRRGTPRRWAPATLAYAAGLGLVVTLAGCGQPAPSGPGGGLEPTVSVPVQPTIAPVTPSDDAPSDPSAAVDEDPYDASSSLTSGTCQPSGDVWSFTGTLKNSDTQQHTFSVGVFIIKTSDSSQVASKEVEVTVAPGATAPVKVEGFWKGPKTGVECLTGVTIKGL
ncbi:hypothetical protein GCM10027053_48910 [Intrasporangium mesophilum]